MRVFKKNQVIITALALMIAAAGYMSYTYGSEEELAVNSQDVVEDSYEIAEEEALIEDEIFTDTQDPALDADVAVTNEEEASAEASIENHGETVLTGTIIDNVNFAVEMKMNREQVRAENKESLSDIINSEALSDAQKQDAIDKMVALTDLAEREAAAEMLLSAKGFSDVVVSISSDGAGADVVLDMGEVTDAKRAQVEDIVSRKTNIDAKNIVITPIQTAQ
ncbi:MAG: SpoIIIAH-like family protein [bacterium]|nr:SpoIIIAH-like family protein [bacterium]